ncbi:hypothetical protein ABZ667_39455 [Streptomyces lavendulae]|uniref:hypothetical protein n=1 Tax=Streptomyces lavendulae TaxID=1914 RepID=UPI0033DD169B
MTSTLNALLEACTAAVGVRRALHLAALRDQVLRLLELSGTTPLLLTEPVPPFWPPGSGWLSGPGRR